MNAMAPKVLLLGRAGSGSLAPCSLGEVGARRLTLGLFWGSMQLGSGGRARREAATEVRASFTLPHVATWPKDRDLTGPEALIRDCA